MRKTMYKIGKEVSNEHNKNNWYENDIMLLTRARIKIAYMKEAKIFSIFSLLSLLLALYYS